MPPVEGCRAGELQEGGQVRCASYMCGPRSTRPRFTGRGYWISYFSLLKTVVSSPIPLDRSNSYKSKSVSEVSRETSPFEGTREEHKIAFTHVLHKLTAPLLLLLPVRLLLLRRRPLSLRNYGCPWWGSSTTRPSLLLRSSTSAPASAWRRWGRPTRRVLRRWPAAHGVVRRHRGRHSVGTAGYRNRAAPRRRRWRGSAACWRLSGWWWRTPLLLSWRWRS